MQTELEREFANTVVRPRLISLVNTRPPTSASDLYMAWLETYPHCSRARFQRWLDELGVRFERRVVVVGLDGPVSELVQPDVGLDDNVFDNE